MLNGVFFRSDNELIDYSRIGSIIGHEITHGFDDNGKNYDDNGFFASWWTNFTLEQYERRVTCFVEQYDRYYIEEIGAYVSIKTHSSTNY